MPPVTVPTEMPSILRTGDSLYFLVTNSDYPASAGWIMSYEFNPDGPATINSTASGANHLFSKTPTETAVYVSGDYIWRSFVTKTIVSPASVERYTIATGTLQIRSATYKSTAKTMLDAIDDYLTGATTFESLQWTAKSLGDMSVSRSSGTDDIIKSRAYWQAIYDSELAKSVISSGSSISRTVYARFNRT